MRSPLVWVGGVGGLLLPWMEGGGWLLLPFAGDIGVLWVGTVGGHSHRWWVPWTAFAGASGGARWPLVGVGDGRSPPFALPRCVLAFTVGRGWWVLVLALALICVAWLRTPVCHWWWVLTPAGVASLGAHVHCLRGMVVGAHARPHPCSCHLAACSHWWWVLRPIHVASLGAHVCDWWGMVGGTHPHLCPSLCAHPGLCGLLHGTVVVCRCGCVCWRGLVRCVWDERAHHGLKDGRRTTYPSSFVIWLPRR